MAPFLRPPKLIEELLQWSEIFESGRLRDRSLKDGTLQPGERFAVRIGPVKQVCFALTADSTVESSGATGALVATDRRALLLDGTRIIEELVWSRDIAGVVPLPMYVVLAPSPERFAAGHGREGLAIPSYTSLRVPIQQGPARTGLLNFTKVQVAWRASQPGGIPAWRYEFQREHADKLRR